RFAWPRGPAAGRRPGRGGLVLGSPGGELAATRPGRVPGGAARRRVRAGAAVLATQCRGGAVAGPSREAFAATMTLTRPGDAVMMGIGIGGDDAVRTAGSKPSSPPKRGRGAIVLAGDLSVTHRGCSTRRGPLDVAGPGPDGWPTAQRSATVLAPGARRS